MDLRAAARRLWSAPRSLLLGWALMGAGVGLYALAQALFVPASVLVVVGFVVARAWRWQGEVADESFGVPEAHRARPASGWREIVAALGFVGILAAGSAGADGLTTVLGVLFCAWLGFAAFIVPRRS